MLTSTLERVPVADLILKQSLIFIRAGNVIILGVTHAVTIILFAAKVPFEGFGILAILSLWGIYALIARSTLKITTSWLILGLEISREF